MKIRIISGVVGSAILLPIVFIGGTVLHIFILLITLIGLYEFNNTVRKNNFKPIDMASYLFAILLFVLTLYTKNTFNIIIMFYNIVLLSLLVFKKELTLKDVGITLLSSIYIPFSLLHIVFLDGNILIWLVFIIAFGTDTFAYFAGNLYSVYNKNPKKLCPSLSPNKTIAGFVGGLLGSLLLCLIYVKILNVGNYLEISVLSILGSVISVLGDLVASKIKRLSNVKDYGNIMPGHGGILDRFDSILFTAPIVYYYITYIL